MNQERSAIEKVRLSGGEVDSSLTPCPNESRFDDLMEGFSDWFSSILIKETRQAVKSRQFIWTYILQLVLVASWTAIGFGTLGNQLGEGLLTGYFIILGFPLALIIPFSAYRSLSREFEDGTIKLISITTMKPRQIVLGKLGSALIQLTMYLAVIAPCISFTYLLQGISIWNIMSCLSICVGGSIFLTILGLFLAGSFRSRSLGVGVSVVFVLVLGLVYFGWILFVIVSGITDLLILSSEEYFIFSGILFSFSSTALILLASVIAQISFPSDNRSTWVRIMMLLQQTLFFAWVFHILSEEAYRNHVPTILLMWVGHYWLLMGFLLCGESSKLSRRVRRNFPSTLPSRLFLSLFMPGAGRGFLFALANIWSAFLIILILAIYEKPLFDWSWLPHSQRPSSRLASFSWLEEFHSMFICMGFVTWFLSLVFLLNRCILSRVCGHLEPGYGPVLSLVSGTAIFAFITVFAAIISGVFIEPMASAVASSFNWYEMSFAPIVGTQWAIFFIVFGIQAVIITGWAILLASQDFLMGPIATPERVLIELKPIKISSLPVGESIDEIFGELPSKTTGDGTA